MEITIGICAYNEQANIAKLLKKLLNQQLEDIAIKEIIVVSSGSTDNTNQIVKSIAEQNPKVKLITEDRRCGKVSGINKIIKQAKTRIIVLISADVLPKNNTIHEICQPLKDRKVGIVGCRPIPVNKANTWLGFAVNLVWYLHHQIALKSPKFGECIAFRNIIKQLPRTAVDEEQIAALISKKGYKLSYAPKAIVLNKGPENIADFIKQRRRIFAGHLALSKKFGYKPPTMEHLEIAKLIISQIDLKHPFKTSFAIVVEVISRLLGYYDFLTGKQHEIWKIANSTKQL